MIIDKIFQSFAIAWYGILSMWRFELTVKDDVEVPYSISDIETDGIHSTQGLLLYHALIAISEKHNKVKLQYFVFVQLSIKNTVCITSTFYLKRNKTKI